MELITTILRLGKWIARSTWETNGQKQSQRVKEIKPLNEKAVQTNWQAHGGIIFAWSFIVWVSSRAILPIKWLSIVRSKRRVRIVITNNKAENVPWKTYLLSKWPLSGERGWIKLDCASEVPKSPLFWDSFFSCHGETTFWEAFKLLLTILELIRHFSNSSMHGGLVFPTTHVMRER